MTPRRARSIRGGTSWLRPRPPPLVPQKRLDEDRCPGAGPGPGKAAPRKTAADDGRGQEVFGQGAGVGRRRGRRSDRGDDGAAHENEGVGDRRAHGQKSRRRGAVTLDHRRKDSGRCPAPRGPAPASGAPTARCTRQGPGRSSVQSRGHRYWVLRSVQRICRAAGVPTVPAHGLRGTHATLAVSAGATSHVAAAALGHESFSTTARHYAKAEAIDGALQDRVLEKFTVVHGPPTVPPRAA